MRYDYWASADENYERDGVFRVVTDTAPVNGVRANRNDNWTALLTIGSETFQAIFDNQKDAQASVEAGAQDPAPTPAPRRADGSSRKGTLVES